MANEISEDFHAKGEQTFAQAFRQQTDRLLRFGLDCGTSASDLLGIHAHRRSIEDGDFCRAMEVGKLLGWDKRG